MRRVAHAGGIVVFPPGGCGEERLVVPRRYRPQGCWPSRTRSVCGSSTGGHVRVLDSVGLCVFDHRFYSDDGCACSGGGGWGIYHTGGGHRCSDCQGGATPCSLGSVCWVFGISSSSVLCPLRRVPPVTSWRVLALAPLRVCGRWICWPGAVWLSSPSGGRLSPMCDFFLLDSPFWLSVVRILLPIPEWIRRVSFPLVQRLASVSIGAVGSFRRMSVASSVPFGRCAPWYSD